MKTPGRFTAIALTITLSMATGACLNHDWGHRKPKKPLTAGQIAFNDSVKPLFEQRCVWCHGNKSTKGGLNLQKRTIALDPNQKFIVPGKPEQSRIYRSLTLDGAHPKAMPGDGWGITPEREKAFHTWIKSGAPWPEGRAGNLKRRPYRVDLDDYL